MTMNNNILNNVNNNPSDSASGLDSDYFFEGAEKRLEVQFTNSSNSRGMLQITREKWEKLLALVNCQVLSVTSNSHFSAYVLSESSLFVFSDRIMIKTCGNTTLLECLPMLLSFAEENQLSPLLVTYSHKSFMEPQRQLPPYRKFETELELLNSFFPGKGHVLGPIGEGQWFIFQSYPINKSATIPPSDQKIEIIMSDLDRKAMNQFIKTELTAEQVAATAGIYDILPRSTIDGHMFDPCGYSMNGLRDDTYSTIHVTPEEAFSYVSYECNAKTSSYDDVIKKVLAIFKPRRFLAVVYADYDSLIKVDSAFSPDIPGYSRDVINSCTFTSTYSVSCSHFVQDSHKH